MAENVQTIQQVWLEDDEQRRKRSLYLSIAIHTALILLLLLPFLSYEYPPPGQEGVLVSFGMPDIGSGNDGPSAQEIVPVEVPDAEDAAPPETTPVEEVQEKSVPSATSAAQNLVTQDQPSEVSITPQEREALRQKAIADAQLEKQRQEEQRKRQEREAAERAERAKAEALAQKTKQFGQLLEGSGKGNTSSAGNQGDPSGDPNAMALEGITKGSGKVGGGLSDRGVMYEPAIDERSQKTGRVVIKVCVNETGKVQSADFTQRGSTTTDAQLTRLAEESALNWKFTPSDISLQCGTITVDFKVQ